MFGGDPPTVPLVPFVPPSTSQPPPPTTSIEAMSLSTKIPDFWVSHPRLWFAQFESIMKPQKKGDEEKFHLVVAKLGLDALQQVSDILSEPPDADKYTTLKSRLISVYEESESRQFQKLVSEMELGDQRPSQLLRRMRDLAKKKVPDETLRIMWTGHLPPAVRAVLSISDIKDLDKLAQIADTVTENIRPQSEVSLVSRQPDVINILTQKIDQLQIEIAEIRKYHHPRGRTPFRSYSRGRSRSRSKSRNGTWVCYFHKKFGQKATKCANKRSCGFNQNQSEN